MTDTINLRGLTQAEAYVADNFSYLIGKTIKHVRPLRPDEVDMYAWEHSKIPPYVIIFTDGSYAIPSCDEEGNEAGFMFLSERDG